MRVVVRIIVDVIIYVQPGLNMSTWSARAPKASQYLSFYLRAVNQDPSPGLGLTTNSPVG